MKTLDELFAEIARRDLFLSNLCERTDATLQPEALCFLKRRTGHGWQMGKGPTCADAIQAALDAFGPERKSKAVVDDFEDLLG